MFADVKGSPLASGGGDTMSAIAQFCETPMTGVSTVNLMGEFCVSPLCELCNALRNVFVCSERICLVLSHECIQVAGFHFW